MFKKLIKSLVTASLMLMVATASAQMGGGMGGPPDLTEAAETLGVTQEELAAALGEGRPDFAAAAEKLGITEEELMAAMPAPPGGGGRPE